MENFTGLYWASNNGVVKFRIDFAPAETYRPQIFLEALGGYMGDGEIIYTRLREQDRVVYDEIRERYGISEWSPAEGIVIVPDGNQ